MLALYTYYCIVQRGGKGWKIWSMRRNAAKKVCSLPLASPEQIKKREDNCAICLLVSFLVNKVYLLFYLLNVHIMNKTVVFGTIFVLSVLAFGR